MSKITINEMNYHYTNYYNPIFDCVNLVLDTDWRLGLIGRNGRGKTTFLKLLEGGLTPDKGYIRKTVQTEYFPYTNTFACLKTIDVIKENIGRLKSMEDNMEAILAENDESRFGLYQDILEEYIQADGFEMEGRIKKELNLMKLPEELLERDYELLSGGEKTRMLIISLFLRKNAFILLDEPTNHLDSEGKSTLSGYLKQKSGFILVSHDRQFLDTVTDHILAINKADITLTKGNYSDWKENKNKNEIYEFRTKTRLEKEITNLEKRAVTNRNWAALAEKEKNPFATHNRGNGSRAAKFMRQAKASELALQNHIEEKKQLLKNFEVTKDLALVQECSENLTLVSIENLNFGYNSRCFIQNFTLKINTGDRIWIRGRNGSGKSTLLKIIGKHLPSGNISFCENLTIAESFQEPVLTDGFPGDLIASSEVGDKTAGDKFDPDKWLELCSCLDVDVELLQRPFETFSSGELKKVDIARALAMENQLLLLDEPLNYTDVYFREQLEKAILNYKPTVVFVEHDERFGYSIANRIIELS